VADGVRQCKRPGWNIYVILIFHKVNFKKSLDIAVLFIQELKPPVNPAGMIAERVFGRAGDASRSQSRQ